MKPATFAAAVTAGLATGPRSFTGLAAVVLATPADSKTQPDRALAHPASKTAIGLLALQEWIMDKLPSTPSRLETLGLITRSVGAGAAGAVLARRAQVRDVQATADAMSTADNSAVLREVQKVTPDWKAIALGAATSAAVALGVALIGVQLRDMFDQLLDQDWPGAVLEDASSAALAAAAVYLATEV